MIQFVETNKRDLEAYSAMSKAAGSRADYVQGGGGNTSVKLEGGLMAIKASGYCLKDIEVDRAYAVLDYEALRRFYFGNNPDSFDDVEKEGTACARANTKSIDGLQSLLPSVEAGFHSILRKFVCHTHSVYANLVCCSHELADVAAKAFSGADYTWGWVKYANPGVRLTFSIRDEMARVKEETGKEPSVILMQNHGIIVHSDDADECLKINADANERLAAQFGISADSFPPVSLKKLEEGLYAADVPYLKESLASGAYTQKFLLEEPLYPDQMVFLIGTLVEGDPGDGECAVDMSTGEVTLRMGEKKALVIVETLTALTFIMDVIRKSGRTLSTMGEAAKEFIANWEMEKYRKALVSQK